MRKLLKNHTNILGGIIEKSKNIYEEITEKLTKHMRKITEKSKNRF